MLKLDDPEWGHLNHAYGDASDIPDLLKELAAYPDCSGSESEPYFSLWSALCHQGDVYTASYAAAPHILQPAIDEPGRAGLDYLQLPAAIELARQQGRGPDMPAHLADAYFDTVGNLPRAVAEMQKFDRSEEFVPVAAMAIAVSSGQTKLAEAYMELEPGVVMEFLGWARDR